MYTFIFNDCTTVARRKCDDRGFSEQQTSLYGDSITASSLYDVTSLHTSFLDVPAIGVDHVTESAGVPPCKRSAGLPGELSSRLL